MPSWDKHAISIFVNRAASALFIFNLLRSIPTGNVPPKIPPGMWLGISVSLWPITPACKEAIKTAMLVYFLLGIYEAAKGSYLMLV
ncbi:hypothetical protein EV421DRAFT_184159 [Armillaria borealis]|uniref:Uncharacterized protein n=1 Tax=Armillaria borealis TaxID=47425 RepID=A0AA39JQU2_9AGAR|nr:hypothetical protein EV421DRAFT_184159 [Armillaria borealis]